MRKTKQTILLLFFVSLANVYAQDIEIPDEILSVIEYYLQNTRSEEEQPEQFEVLYDHFRNLYESPIDINKATAEELMQFMVLSDFQIHSLLAYRKDYGLFYSLHELEMVVGFTKETVQTISPFLTLDPEQTKAPQRPKLKHNILIRNIRLLEQQEGFKNHIFLGDPNKTYVRYLAKKNNSFSTGVTLEKDAGEPYFYKNESIPLDFFSAHIAFQNRGKIKNMILGDYRMGFGQGLILWQGFQGGKSSFWLHQQAASSGIRPYTSANENYFMRGIATTLDFSPWEISVFASVKNIDANIITFDTLTNKPIAFSSIQTSGIHNTAGLLNDKDAILEKLGGIRFVRRFTFGKAGVTSLYHKYNAEYTKQDRLYNKYAFSGNEYFAMGFDYQFQFRGLFFEGEEAINPNHGAAFLNKLGISPTPELQLYLLHRYYSKSYYAQYAVAFSEKSTISNEKGLFVGTNITLFSKLKLKGYFDFFQFPWLTYNTSSPSYGTEYQLEAEYPLGKNIDIKLRKREQQKLVNSTESNERITSQQLAITDQYMIASTLRLNTCWSLSTKGYFKQYIETKTIKGWLFAQDIKYTQSENHFAVTARVAYFNTDDYTSRIYIYENDLAYVFNIPAYYNQGFRYYFVLRIKPTSAITCYAKAGQYHYINTNSFGTGLTEIQGNHKTEIKLQVNYSF